MAVYKCTACDAAYQATDDMVGKHAKCPHCGAVTIVGGTTDTPVTIGASASTQGKVASVKDLLHPNEEVLYDRNPSKTAMLVKMVTPAAFVLLGIISILLGRWGGVVFVLIGGLSVLAVYLSWKHTEYVVTDKRSFLKVGVFNHRIIILMNRNIQTTSINTGIIDRMLGLNTIVIRTAGGGSFLGLGGSGIAYRHIDNVRDFMRAYGQ